jgi:hypothetical protein
MQRWVPLVVPLVCLVTVPLVMVVMIGSVLFVDVSPIIPVILGSGVLVIAFVVLLHRLVSQRASWRIDQRVREGRCIY